MTAHIKAIEAAIKAKAPIVAIPVEGHAPFCMRRKILAGWAKGVLITRTEFFGEGRWLKVEGRTKNGYVRCYAKFAPMDRRAATKELARWSDKEREKIQKQRALGVLSKEAQRAMKLAKLEIVETYEPEIA